MLKLKRTILLFVLATFASANAAQAATYYVATTGNNGYTCAQAQTKSTPKQTVAAGVACLASGDTLIVGAGTYTISCSGCGMIQDPPAGTASAYTTIKADPNGARPVFSLQHGTPMPGTSNVTGTYQFGFLCTTGSACNHIEVNGFDMANAYQGVNLQGTSTLGYATYINFINNKVHDTLDSAWYIATDGTGNLSGGGGHLIRGNEWYNVGIWNPHYIAGQNAIYTPGNSSIVDYNTFHDCINGVGIWVSVPAGGALKNVTVRNNLFYNMARYDIDTWMQAGNTGSSYAPASIHVSVSGGGFQIYNNIFYDNCQPYADINQGSCRGVTVGTHADNTSTTNVYNNTFYNFYHPSAVAVNVDTTKVTSTSVVQVKNNISYQIATGFSSGSTQTNNLLTNPFFVGATDLHLQSGSAAIDAGTTVAGVTVDYAGTPRPQGAAYDIGAYEFGGTTSPPPAPNNLRIQ